MTAVAERLPHSEGVMHSRRVFTPVELFSMCNPASSRGFVGDSVHNSWAAPSQSIFAASGDEFEDDFDEDDFDDDFEEENDLEE